MLKNIKGNLKADALILSHSSFVRWSLLISALITAFVLSTSSGLASLDSHPGYYTSQLLITLSQFNVFLTIIAGAFLGAKDFDWLTYSVRVVGSRRAVLFVSRTIMILAISITIVIANYILGFIFDSLGKTVAALSLEEFFKFWSVTLIVFFWGELSFLVAFLSKNFSLASSLGVGYILLESFLGRFIPTFLLQALPIWNQKSLLKYFFPENEGAVAVIQQSYGDWTISLIVMLLFTIIVTAASFISAAKKSY